MASKKDMRRPDLIIPYVDNTKDNNDSSDFVGSMTNTLPIAAMFTRNKLLAWTSVLFAMQSWMSETPDNKVNGSMPGWGSFMMAIASLGVGYLPMFVPPNNAGLNAGSGTEAPAAAPI